MYHNISFLNPKLIRLCHRDNVFVLVHLYTVCIGMLERKKYYILNALMYDTFHILYIFLNCSSIYNFSSSKLLSVFFTISSSNVMKGNMRNNSYACNEKKKHWCMTFCYISINLMHSIEKNNTHKYIEKRL